MMDYLLKKFMKQISFGVRWIKKKKKQKVKLGKNIEFKRFNQF